MTGSSDKAASRPRPGVLNQPVRVPRRRTLLFVSAAILLAAGAFVLWRYYGSNPPAWITRWRVQRFLKKESHTGNFKVADFAFPSKADLGKKPSPAARPDASLKAGESANDFETLRDEYFTLKTSVVILERGIERAETELKESTASLDALTKQLADAQTAAATNVSQLESNAVELRTRIVELRKTAAARGELNAKETALVPIVEALWKHQRGFMAEVEAESGSDTAAFARSRNQFVTNLGQQFDKAQSYADMYKLVGQELWVASRLLDAANPEYARAGLTLALSASKHALNQAQNGWVAARICEGYVLPHLELADDANRRSPFNRDNLLGECADIFRRNSEYEGVVRTYQTALAQAGTTQRADWARSEISKAYEDAGNLKAALRYIREIKGTNDFRRDMFRAKRIEQQLKSN
jgi:hypothetical protein